MIVKLKRSLIGSKHRVGDIVTLPDNTAKNLIKKGLAIAVEQPKETTKAKKSNVENRQRKRK